MTFFKKNILFLLLLSQLFFSWVAIAQDLDTDLTKRLEESAIVKELETSTLAELQDWALILGLNSSSKNEGSLKNSIAKFYNITIPPKEERDSEKDIVINSAELTKYYTLEEVSENIVELEGRVDIVIQDIKKNISHSIVADKIVFNRTLNSVTASGNVIYNKDENGSIEEVTAESLTFNISNWRGSIIKCISKQVKEVNEEEMEFYYVTGEIKKSDTDVMGMKDVTIQTVTGSPYFNISAADLWMLDSSDFVIISPSIRVGHVPLFWAPFYYYSENSLYFNPVYGVKSREGTFLQNTIYFMGNKSDSEEDSEFSFLSFNNGKTVSNKEFNSLTLIPSENNIEYSSDYSKIIVDYYSNLGLFIGNETEIKSRNKKSELYLLGGFGFSRNIDDITGNLFNNGVSEWNNSSILGYQVPFRFLLDIDIKTPFFKITMDAPSDPYFKSDFLDRKENFKWIDYATDKINGGLDNILSESDGSYARTTELFPETTSISWVLDFENIRPKTDPLKPFLTYLSIDFKQFKLDFDSKISRDENNQIQYEDYDPKYKFFYPEEAKLPLTLKARGSLLDTTYSKKEVSKLVTPPTIEEGYKESLFKVESPLKGDTDQEESNSESNENLDTQDLKESLFTIKEDKIFSDINNSISNKEYNYFSFNYDMTLPVSINNYWDSTEIYNIDDIEYKISKNTLLINFDPYFTTDIKAGIFDSFLTIDNRTKGNRYLKQYLQEDEQSDLLSNYKWNKTLLNDNLEVKLNFLEPFDSIRNHSLDLSYNLDVLLYRSEFDQDLYKENPDLGPTYSSEVFKWEDEFVNKNNLSLTYQYSKNEFETELEYKRILPPLDDETLFTYRQNLGYEFVDGISYDLTSVAEFKSTVKDSELNKVVSVDEEVNLKLFDFNANLESGFDFSESFIEDDEDSWRYDPLNINFKYNLKELLSFTSSFEYSFDTFKVEDYSFGINMFDFELDISSEYDEPIYWDVDNLQWVVESEKDKTLKLDSMELSHTFKLKDYYFWKNRVKLNIDSDLSFTKEFIRIDRSEIKYSLDFNLDIYKFLNLEIISSSTNREVFRYFNKDSETLGLNSSKNIFVDLVKSFNFFNLEDRVSSGFNLNSIELNATYKMPDWDLVFSYKGYPELKDRNIEWYQAFSLFVEWKPLSIVRSNVENKNDLWSVSTSSQD